MFLVPFHVPLVLFVLLSDGKLMLQMFSAFAEFERNRIRERTKEGLERAKAQDKS